MWERKEQAKKAKEHEKKRQEQIKKEAETEELEKSIGGELGGKKASLGFMYNAPGGSHVNEEKEDDGHSKKEECVDDEGEASSVPYDEDDDEATRAFKRMMAGFEEKPSVATSRGTPTKEGEDRAALEDELFKEANKNLTALEKATGKRRSATDSWKNQTDMFPELKNAPVAKGMHGTNVAIKFNPLVSEEQVKRSEAMQCNAQ